MMSDQDANNFNNQNEKVKVYGSKYALTLESSMTKGSSTKPSRNTITIEAAKSVGQNRFDWQNKVAFQLTPAELRTFAQVFLGFKNELSFKNHGPNNDKWMSVERQVIERGARAGEEKFFLKLGSQAGIFPVPVEMDDVFDIQALALKRISDDHPHLGVSNIMAMLESNAARKLEPEQERAKSRHQDNGASYG